MNIYDNYINYMFYQNADAILDPAICVDPYEKF